jgi:hypothetical protein
MSEQRTEDGGPAFPVGTEYDLSVHGLDNLCKYWFRIADAMLKARAESC